MPDQPDGNEAISQEALDALLADMTEKDAELFRAEAAQGQPEGAAAEADAGDAGEADADAGEADADAGQGGEDIALNFATFQGAASTHASEGSILRGFERVQDIPLDITVELGRTKLLIRDILDLETGAIIELEKMAGEPVELLANGLLVARGEVVVIEDNFGVRITEIITQKARSELADWPEERRAA